MKEPRIKQKALPSAPYPKTPVFIHQTVEVPADAVVIELPPYKAPKAQKRKKAQMRPMVIPSKAQDKPLDRELMPNEVERVLIMYKTGYTLKQIAFSVKCKLESVEEVIKIAKEDGEI